jgi:hypothetical protein
MSEHEFTPADAKRFYDRFGSKQDLQFYENAALEHLPPPRPTERVREPVADREERLRREPRQQAEARAQPRGEDQHGDRHGITP